MRLDADLYESTMDALRNLYPKLSVGGYVIVDDYKLFNSCRGAVDDFRRECNIADPIHEIDWSGIYWRREH
jgi:O-methyltransferase